MPKIVEINQEEFEKLCHIHCTIVEIAGWFNCSDETIRNWCKKTYGKTFNEVFDDKSARGKASLRRIQFKLAERNASMAIFLGKQYLGQKDYVEETKVVDNGILDKLIGALEHERDRRNVK